MKIRTSLVALMSLTLSQLALSCASETPQDVIQQAKQAQKKATAVQGEWRDVGKLIRQAEKALTTGDSAKAKQLARRAIDHADLGYQQAQQPKNVHPQFLQ